MSDPAAAALLEAGVVVKPHGLDGSFSVARARPALLESGREVEVGGVRRRIAARRGTDERPLLTLDGVATREAAEALRGEALLALRGDAPALGEGEFWAEDLVGCSVVDGERRLGAVRALIALPSCEALELEDGRLVPLVADAVREVDVERRAVHVDAGFLGL